MRRFWTETLSTTGVGDAPRGEATYSLGRRHDAVDESISRVDRGTLADGRGELLELGFR